MLESFSLHFILFSHVLMKKSTIDDFDIKIGLGFGQSLTGKRLNVRHKNKRIRLKQEKEFKQSVLNPV